MKLAKLFAFLLARSVLCSVITPTPARPTPVLQVIGNDPLEQAVRGNDAGALQSLLDNTSLVLPDKGAAALKAAVDLERSVLLRELLRDARVRPVSCAQILLETSLTKPVIILKRLLEHGSWIDPTANHSAILKKAALVSAKHLEILLRDGRADPSVSHFGALLACFDCVTEDNVKSRLHSIKVFLNDSRVTFHAFRDLYLTLAAGYGQYDLVKSLIESGRYGCPQEAVLAADKNGHVDTVRLLLSSKWADPSADSNSLFRSSRNIAVKQLVLEDERFYPSRLDQAVVPVMAIDHMINFLCSSDTGAIRLFSQNLATVSQLTIQEKQSMLLIARASTGDLGFIQNLLAFQPCTTYMNSLAVRMAALNGHFDVAKLIVRSDVNLDSFLQTVFEPALRSLWVSAGGFDLARRTVAVLRALWRNPIIFGLRPRDVQARRYFLHRLGNTSLCRFLVDRVELLTAAARKARCTEKQAMLLHLYGIVLPRLGTILTRELIPPTEIGPFERAVSHFIEALSRLPWQLNDKQYIQSTPLDTFNRLYLTHYDRMMLAGAHEQDATAYASARKHKGLYYQRRSRAGAYSNQTVESRQIHVSRHGGLPALNPAFAITYPGYLIPHVEELINRFGHWLVTFEDDFERFASGIEIVNFPLPELLGKIKKGVIRAETKKKFLQEHPGYLAYYNPADWKKVHGFDQIANENGAMAVVTVYDRFKNIHIPDSMAPSILHSQLGRTAGRPDDHGIQVASLLSHPTLGVSPAIKLNLFDISNTSSFENSLDMQGLENLDHRDFSRRVGLSTNFLNLIGDVLNVSQGAHQDFLWESEHDHATAVHFTTLRTIVEANGCLLIFAAGNSGSRARIGFAGPKFLASSPVTRSLFINAVALLDDGLHLAPSTDQPGDHQQLYERSLCAFGTDVPVLKYGTNDRTTRESGTSFATPIISAAAALLVSHLKRRFGTNNEHLPKFAATALLLSATPILLIPTEPGERQQMKSLLEYETPVALGGVMAKDLGTTRRIRVTIGSSQRIVEVTPEIIEKSRSRYGMGRLNVPAAFQLVNELTRYLPHAASCQVS